MERVKFTIRQARMYAEKEQKEVAEALGMSVSSYIKYENYRHYFRVDKAKLFAQITGLPFEDIIFFDGKLHLNCS